MGAGSDGAWVDRSASPGVAIQVWARRAAGKSMT